MPKQLWFKDCWAYGRSPIGKVLAELIRRMNVLLGSSLDLHFPGKRRIPGWCPAWRPPESHWNRDGVLLCWPGSAPFAPWDTNIRWHMKDEADTFRSPGLLSALCLHSSWLQLSVTIPEAAIDKSSLGFQGVICFSSGTQKEFLSKENSKTQGF